MLGRGTVAAASTTKKLITFSYHSSPSTATATSTSTPSSSSSSSASSALGHLQGSIEEDNNNSYYNVSSSLPTHVELLQIQDEPLEIVSEMLECCCVFVRLWRERKRRERGESNEREAMEKRIPHMFLYAA